jgi:hypothetical protein
MQSWEIHLDTTCSTKSTLQDHLGRAVPHTGSGCSQTAAAPAAEAATAYALLLNLLLLLLLLLIMIMLMLEAYRLQ